MPDFKMYRVFCSTSAMLEDERRTFHDHTGTVNENGGVESGILFIPVTLRGDAATGGMRAAVMQNVRDADFFVQILGNSWGPPSAGFEELFDLALDCRSDSALPMRDVAVLLKKTDPSRLKPDVAQFRATAEQNANLKVMYFEDSPSLIERITELLTGWREQLKATPPKAVGGEH
jgi:hypothetical protein